MKSKIDSALQQFTSGYNCAQSVLLAFTDELNIDPETAAKITSGFGAGMGRKQEVCGAVTGGVMVLSLKYGRGLNDDQGATEKTYLKTRELFDSFTRRHGTVICRDLLNECNLLTDEGQKIFREYDLFNKTCKKCVQSVVQIVEDQL